MNYFDIDQNQKKGGDAVHNPLGMETFEARLATFKPDTVEKDLPRQQTKPVQYGMHGTLL